MMVSDEKAKRLVFRGEAVDFETRTPVFSGGAIVQVGKLKRTPRSMTIEKANMERSVQHRTTKQEAKDIRELKAAVEQDKAWRDQEELERMDHYQALTVASMRIVQIPEAQYDEMQRTDPWRGRAIFAASSDDRSSISVDTSEFHIYDDVQIEEQEEIEPIDEVEEGQSEEHEAEQTEEIAA
jgi:hypothetical protein